MCCFDTFGEFRSGGKCSLDREGSYFTNDDRDDPHPVATGVFAILYRVENGEIAKVRSYSMECVLDANGAAVTWIEGVDPRKSVALLASIIGRPGHHSDYVMSTLAMHADPLATTELERMLNSADAPDETRGHAAFWLGQTRGRRGYEDVLALARSQSASPHLREKAVFALSQSSEPGAIDELIRLAKSDPTAHVRSQALFWLSQKAGKKAAGALRDAARRRSRRRRPRESSLRCLPASGRSVRPHAHRSDEDPPRSRRQEEGRILARTEARPARAGGDRGGPEEVSSAS